MDINDYWNGWRIAEQLGEGTFGTVYRIEKKEYGHVYNSALKVVRVPNSQAEVRTIKNEGMDEKSMTLYFNSMVENIVNELSLMSKLRGNSNIVSYEDHEVVKLEDSFGWDIYIKMEFLRPLYDYVNSKTMTVNDVVKIGIDICKALELCNKNNIIHRDIKPENIFYSEHGDFKLGDFGIARELEKTMAGLSRTGTPSYMAPEVYKGLSYNSSVDTYSLGIVLYRMLNKNRTPFLPDYPELITYEDRQNANMKRLSGENLPMPCNADKELSDIILKACAYDPKDRFESAEEMRKALESYNCPKGSNTALFPIKEDEKEVTPVFSSEDSKNDTETVKLEDVGFLRRHKTSIISAVGLLVLILGVGGYRFFHHSVPQVTGLSIDAAEIVLKNAGLRYKENKVFSDSVEKDVVISQSKDPEQQVKRGTVIEIVVSKGVEQKRVPDVIGMTQEKAEKTLSEAGFKVEVKKVYSLDNEGIVIDQSEDAGDKIDKNTLVLITISSREQSYDDTYYEGGSKNSSTRNSSKKEGRGSAGNANSDSIDDSVETDIPVTPETAINNEPEIINDQPAAPSEGSGSEQSNEDSGSDTE